MFLRFNIHGLALDAFDVLLTDLQMFLDVDDLVGKGLPLEPGPCFHFCIAPRLLFYRSHNLVSKTLRSER
jgi:hypothetical protein